MRKMATTVVGTATTNDLEVKTQEEVSTDSASSTHLAVMIRAGTSMETLEATNVIIATTQETKVAIKNHSENTGSQTTQTNRPRATMQVGKTKAARIITISLAVTKVKETSGAEISSTIMSSTTTATVSTRQTTTTFKTTKNSTTKQERNRPNLNSNRTWLRNRMALDRWVILKKKKVFRRYLLARIRTCTQTSLLLR